MLCTLMPDSSLDRPILAGLILLSRPLLLSMEMLPFMSDEPQGIAPGQGSLLQSYSATILPMCCTNVTWGSTCRLMRNFRRPTQFRRPALFLQTSANVMQEQSASKAAFARLRELRSEIEPLHGRVQAAHARMLEVFAAWRWGSPTSSRGTPTSGGPQSPCQGNIADSQQLTHGHKVGNDAAAAVSKNSVHLEPNGGDRSMQNHTQPPSAPEPLKTHISTGPGQIVRGTRQPGEGSSECTPDAGVMAQAATSNALAATPNGLAATGCNAVSCNSMPASDTCEEDRQSTGGVASSRMSLDAADLDLIAVRGSAQRSDTAASRDACSASKGALGGKEGWPQSGVDLSNERQQPPEDANDAVISGGYYSRRDARVSNHAESSGTISSSSGVDPSDSKADEAHHSPQMNIGVEEALRQEQGSAVPAGVLTGNEATDRHIERFYRARSAVLCNLAR